MKRQTCIKILTACLQIKISETHPSTDIPQWANSVEYQKAYKCWITVTRRKGSEKALDEMLELRSVATQRQHFFFQRIIKPYIMRAKGVSPVIITRLYDAYTEWWKHGAEYASVLIFRCPKKKQKKTPKWCNEPNPVVQKFDIFVCHLLECTKSGLT